MNIVSTLSVTRGGVRTFINLHTCDESASVQGYDGTLLCAATGILLQREGQASANMLLCFAGVP